MVQVISSLDMMITPLLLLVKEIEHLRNCAFSLSRFPIQPEEPFSTFSPLTHCVKIN